MIARLLIDADGVEIKLKRTSDGDVNMVINGEMEIALGPQTAQALGIALIDMGNGEDGE